MVSQQQLLLSDLADMVLPDLAQRLETREKHLRKKAFSKTCVSDKDET